MNHPHSALRGFTVPRVLGSSILSLLLTVAASAADSTWSNSGTGLWTDGINWVGGVPTAASGAIISNGGTAYIGAGQTAAALLPFIGRESGTTGALVIDQGGLLVSDSAHIGHLAGSQGTVTVSGGTWQNTNTLAVGHQGNGTLTFVSGLIASGAVRIADESNSTGLFTMPGGVLQITTELAIGESGNGTMNFQGGEVTTSATNIGKTTGVTGVLTVSGAAVLRSTAHLTVGTVSNGTLNIQGGQVNTALMRLGENAGASGQMTMSAGTLQVSNQFQLGTSGTGTFNLSGGTVTVSDFLRIGTNNGSQGTMTVTGGTLNANNQLHVGSDGTGTLTLNSGLIASNANIYVGTGATSQGTLNVNGGTIQSPSDTGIGFVGHGVLNLNSGAMSVLRTRIGQNANSNGTVVLSGTTGNRGVLSTQQVLRGDGTGVLKFNGGILRATGSQSSFISGLSVQFLSGGAFIDSNGFDISTSMLLEGEGGLTKMGAGNLTLDGTNTYSGGTTISGGYVVAGSQAALGSSGSITFNGGGLRFGSTGAASGANSLFARFSTAAGQNYLIDLGGRNFSVSTSLTSPGSSFTLVGSGRLALTANNSLSAIAIMDSAVLDLVGENSVSGGVTLQGGGLSLQNPNALGSTGTIAFKGGVLGFAAETASVANSFVSRFSSAPGETDYRVDSGGQDITFTTPLPAGPGSFRKQGGGSITLAGTNTYTGGTTVVAGKLIVNGSIVGTTVVQSSASLAGSGTLSGSATIQNGGTLAPGNSAGLLTFGDDLTLQAGSITTIELGGLAAAEFDRVSVEDVITFGGTLKLSLINGFVPQVGDSFQLFQDFNSQSGTFSSVVFTNPGFAGSLNYATGTFSIIAVPEPSVSLLTGVSLLGIVARRRRRVNS